MACFCEVVNSSSVFGSLALYFFCGGGKGVGVGLWLCGCVHLCVPNCRVVIIIMDESCDGIFNVQQMTIFSLSILMAIGIRGRSLLVSCTQSRPTFKNRTASSLEKSPLSAGSSS